MSGKEASAANNLNNQLNLNSKGEASMLSVGSILRWH